MPTINFPSNPSVNDTYTFGGKTWIWNGAAWQLQSQGGINNIPIGNSTPSTGAFTTLNATGNLLAFNIAATDTISATGNITGAALSVGTGQITAGNILPAANVTYDLGTSTTRWKDIWLANSTIYLGEANISASGESIVLPANTTVGGAVVAAVPKISGFTYPGDDTAAAPAGGQTILVNGANFEVGVTIYLDNAVISPVTRVSSSQLSFTSPAKATGTYSLYVVNPDGSTALALPGIIYSGVPTWTTAAGNVGAPYETNSFTTTLAATSDSAITYAVAPGNSLPANLSLDSSTGNLTGTIPVTANATTYTFSVRATDAEQQDTDRQFSVTYQPDVVTWSSPANATSYSWVTGTANTVSLLATSAAGKAVTYALQSGSLPANVTVSGNTITGAPTATQSNTAAVIRATAATTNRFADTTLYFTISPSGPSVIGEAYGGGYYAGKLSATGDGVATHYLIVAPKATGQADYALKSSSGAVYNMDSLWDGYTNTNNNNNSGFPGLQWARSLTIGGYTDWYVPSIYEMMIIYWFLKPDSTFNASQEWTGSGGWGYNTNAVAPYPVSNSSYWTKTLPGQTSVALFQSGQAQSIMTSNPSEIPFFTSTAILQNYYPGRTTGFYFNNGQGMSNGGSSLTIQNMTTVLPIRAIRKVPV